MEAPAAPNYWREQSDRVPYAYVSVQCTVSSVQRARALSGCERLAALRAHGEAQGAGAARLDARSRLLSDADADADADSDSHRAAPSSGYCCTTRSTVLYETRRDETNRVESSICICVGALIYRAPRRIAFD